MTILQQYKSEHKSPDNKASKTIEVVNKDNKKCYILI